MCKLIEWPHYDRDEAFRLSKVINEPDFLPLHVVRLLAQAATLVRAKRGKLLPTPLGKSMLSDARQGSLSAILFHLAFFTWISDISAAACSAPGRRGHRHCAVVAIGFRRRLANPREADAAVHHTRASHTVGDLRGPTPWRRDPAATVVVRLLEYHTEKIADSRFAARHYYRKAALFDRLLAFDVKWILRRVPSLI